MKVTKIQLALLVFQPAYEPGISQQKSRIFLVCGIPPPFFRMKKKISRHNFIGKEIPFCLQ